MSSSFLKAVLLAIPVAGGMLVQSAFAADWYWIPEVEASAESHSNLNLEADPALADGGEGFRGTVGATIGARTQRATTEFRPRFLLQKYPDREDMQRVNEYLDLRSNYAGQRSEFELNASLHKEDRLNSEMTEAEFDDFDPDDPTVDQTGRVSLTSETRTRLNVRPTYEYRLTERVGLKVEGTYQTVEFDTDGPTESRDYDYGELTGLVEWRLGPRSRIGAGAYAGKYATDDNSYVSDSLGLTLEFNHDWTETFSGFATLDMERTDIAELGFADETSNDWGLSAGGRWRWEVSSLRLSMGNSFTPSNSGTRSEVQELRVQYDRRLRERWSVRGALRGLRTRAQGERGSEDDRDYFRTEVEVKRLMSPTWYIAGGYSYTWQEYTDATASADDNRVYLSFGYLGRAPQR